MTFTSISFAPFVIGVLLASLVAGRRRRWLVLLAASYFFYASLKIPYLLAVLAAVTLASFLCAVAMEKQAEPGRRRALLWLGLAANLGALGVLKYSGFAAENVNALGGALGLRPGLPTGQLFASIGVSYYALQAVSYLLDVHDEAVPAQRHLGRFALYLSFFPKIIQGPIERAEALLPQLDEPRPLSLADLAAGAQLILWGLFQKVVVADALAPFVQTVYGDARRFEGAPLLVATYFFAAQLYFDFAGYTDMAIGVARLFGLRLSQNFRSPYLSTSVAEFWRRWHISFSSLLSDYVFKPLQLELRDLRTWGTPLALLATFLVSGLWHGATWSFVFWGLLHGLFLGASTLYRPLQKRWHQASGLAGTRLLSAAQVAITFHLVCLAWVFFRATSLADALWMTHHFASGLPASLARLARGEELETLLYLGQGRGRFAFALALIAFGAALRPRFRGLADAEGAATPRALSAQLSSAAVNAVMFYLIAFFGAAAQGFLYEQF